MSPRPYRLGKRAADVEDTRDRVIQAARELFSEEGFLGASLEDVAKRAGVSRATVYYQFESKYGLLDGMIVNATQIQKAAPLDRARKHPNALKGLRTYLVEICKFWMGDLALFRNVYGLASVDPEAGKLFDGYDNRRRELLVWLVKRLADQGHLRPGMTQQRATDVLWLLSSFRSFDQLHTRARLSAKQAASLLNELAGTLLSDAGAASEAQRPAT